MQRVLITGATGFVGGNVAQQLVEHGADVLCVVRRDPGPDFPWPWRLTDLGDTTDIANALREHEATSVVHLAIDGAFESLASERRAAYDGYVGMTRRVVDAANANGALVALISTDWVFDGRGHLVDEDEPVMPINMYGMLKAQSEQVVLDRAVEGFIARVGGVQARNIAWPQAPWLQTCGFGNLALAVVAALSTGQPFTVWEGEGANEVASPIAAQEIGKRLSRALELRVDGVLHLVGAGAVSRMELAEATCEVFGLDTGLLSRADVPVEHRMRERVPYDTSLSTARTDEVLGARPLSVLAQLRSIASGVSS